MKGGTKGYGDSSTRLDGNYNRKSGVVALLPYLEQAGLYNRIEAGNPSTSPPIPPGGPAPWSGWSGWNQKIAVFKCPSDPGITTARGSISYAMNIGDYLGTSNQSPTNVNGLFAYNTCYGLSSILDGSSNTIAFSERVQASFGIGGKANPDIREGDLTNVPSITTSPGACLAAAAAITNGNRYTDGSAVKGKFGSYWCDGQPENVAFTPILAPNSPSCVTDTNSNSDSAVSLLSASSHHTGGVHAVFADGSVRFISDSIDTGNLGVPTTLGGRSPYGVWGALGTKSGGETVSTGF
jgi:hypothetical protein